MNGQFFVNLVALAVDAQLPVDYYAARANQQAGDELARLEAQRHSLEQTLWARYYDAAWAAAGQKPPLIQARSLMALFELSGNTGRGFTTPFSPERSAELKAAVVPVFEQLSSYEQYRLLEAHWRQFRGDDLLPALREIVATEPKPGDTAGGPLVLDSALKRIVELAPKEGRELILAETRRKPLRASAQSLLLLPREPVPQIDDVLAEMLEDGA